MSTDEPWSDLPTKITPVGGDILAILDSEDSDPNTKNKIITISSIPGLTGNTLNDLTDVTITSQKLGDIIYADSTISWANLNPGVDGQVLTLAGGIPSWSNSISSLTPWIQDIDGATFQLLNAGSVGIGTSTPNIVNLSTGNVVLDANASYVNILNDTEAVLILQGDMGGEINLVDNNANADEKWFSLHTVDGSTLFEIKNDVDTNIHTPFIFDHDTGLVTLTGNFTANSDIINFNGNDATVIFNVNGNHSSPTNTTIIAEINYIDETTLGGGLVNYVQLESVIVDPAPSTASGEFHIDILEDAISVAYVNFNKDNQRDVIFNRPLSMNGSNKIIDVSDPTAAQDAATKNYVDTQGFLTTVALDDLSDVTITPTTVDDLLVSDVEGTWVNRQGVFTGITGIGEQSQVLDMNDNAINLDASQTHQIIFDGTDKMGFFIPTGSEFDFNINGSPVMQINGTNTDFVGRNLVQCGEISFSTGAPSHINATTAPDDMTFTIGNELGLRLIEEGTEINTILGAANALALTATDGFLYLPSMAGAPTGNSTDYTGKFPIVWDSTNNALMLNTTGTTWVEIGGETSFIGFTADANLDMGSFDVELDAIQRLRLNGNGGDSNIYESAAGIVRIVAGNLNGLTIDGTDPLCGRDTTTSSRTSDFLRFAASQGTPTGTPFVTGTSHVPMTFDNLGRKLYVHDDDDWREIGATSPWKASARVASTADIDLTVASDPSPVDGVTLANGDRILLKDQTAGAENGIYDCVTATDPTTWIRSTDADISSELLQMVIAIQEGSVSADLVYMLTTNAPIVIDTTLLSYSEFGGGTSFIGFTADAILDMGSFAIDMNDNAINNATYFQTTAATSIVAGVNLANVERVRWAQSVSGYVEIILDANDTLQFTDGTDTMHMHVTTGSFHSINTNGAGGFSEMSLKAGVSSGIEFLKSDHLGNAIVGLDTTLFSRTDGFLYFPPVTQAPTGTPTTLGGGVPMTFDTGTNTLYVFNSSWQSIGVGVIQTVLAADATEEPITGTSLTQVKDMSFIKGVIDFQLLTVEIDMKTDNVATTAHCRVRHDGLGGDDLDLTTISLTYEVLSGTIDISSFSAGRHTLEFYLEDGSGDTVTLRETWVFGKE